MKAQYEDLTRYFYQGERNEEKYMSEDYYKANLDSLIEALEDAICRGSGIMNTSTILKQLRIIRDNRKRWDFNYKKEE